MSKTFSIACTKCKKHLWIGQKPSVSRKGHIYSCPKIHRHLTEFLFEHTQHELIFDENCDSVIGDFEEVHDED